MSALSLCQDSAAYKMEESQKVASQNVVQKVAGVVGESREKSLAFLAIFTLRFDLTSTHTPTLGPTSSLTFSSSLYSS